METAPKRIQLGGAYKITGQSVNFKLTSMQFFSYNSNIPISRALIVLSFVSHSWKCTEYVMNSVNVDMY
jgi:hypothetical protein